MNLSVFYKVTQGDFLEENQKQIIYQAEFKL